MYFQVCFKPDTGTLCQTISYSKRLKRKNSSFDYKSCYLDNDIPSSHAFRIKSTIECATIYAPLGAFTDDSVTYGGMRRYRTQCSAAWRWTSVNKISTCRSIMRCALNSVRFYARRFLSNIFMVVKSMTLYYCGLNSNSMQHRHLIYCVFFCILNCIN